ncbi:MAG: phage coat protein [Parcubacteria group bacterium]|jgi:hypothetical protein|nr:phage coat protein [Parcubacteria group bacterium]|tara:strand:- start:11420 stop:12427 length:1008 start_codon:yes stop_codon:yes gene_type:complete
MASVRLADVIDVEVYQDLSAVNSPEKTAFYESGVIVSSPELDTFANSPSQTGTLPFWNDIDSSLEPNYGDDSDDLAVPNKVGQDNEAYFLAYMNQGFSAKNLVNQLTMGADALVHVRNRIDAYWTRQWQKRLIQSALGILADNVANDSADMLFTAYQDIASPTAAEKFSLKNFNAAVIGTMGDAFTGLTTIVMHSAVYHTLADNNEAEDVRDSEGTLLYRSYKGHRIVIDDSMPVTTGSNSDKYTSIIFGGGVFGYGVGSPDNPVELERKEASGKGAGEDILWTRKTWLLHPRGFKHEGTPAGQSFDLTELATAAVWDRVVERKNVNLAFLETNV